MATTTDTTMTSESQSVRLPEDACRPGAIDYTVVGVMLVLGSLAIFITHDLFPEDAGDQPQWVGHLALALLVIPLLARRMAPTAVGLWVGLGFAVFRLFEIPEGAVSSLAVFLGTHAVGAYTLQPRVRNSARLLIIGAGFVALTVSLLTDAEVVTFDSAVLVLLSVGINVAFYVAAWFLGDATRHRRADSVELQHRADQIAAERDRQAHQAVMDERVRIARELHDVVAHHVSVMGVQAAAAGHVLDREPAQAARALANVEESARQAVLELQRLVGMLRSDGDSETVPAAPQPTLEELPMLLQSTQAAGVEVSLRVIGQAQPVAASVELSIYRIVQEGLTNVVRHAPGAPTTVVLSHLEDRIQVEVVNQRRMGTPTTAGAGGGRGLLGMRERVAMLGGSIDCGPDSRGGYRIVAVLPRAQGIAADQLVTR